MSVRLYWRNTGAAPDYDLSTDIGTAATVAITTSNNDAWQSVSTNWSVALADPPTETSFPTSVVITARGNGVIRIRVSRANSGGTILASSAWGNELASVGTHTQVFTLATTWAAGDRLVIQVEERRAPNTHGGSTVDVGVNREATHVDYTAGPPEVLGAATLAATAQLTADAVIVPPNQATLAATATLAAWPNRRHMVTLTHPGVRISLAGLSPNQVAIWEESQTIYTGLTLPYSRWSSRDLETAEGMYRLFGRADSSLNSNPVLVRQRRDGTLTILREGPLLLPPTALAGFDRVALGQIGSKLYICYAYIDTALSEFSRGVFAVDTYDLDTQAYEHHGSITGLNSQQWETPSESDTSHRGHCDGVVIGSSFYVAAQLHQGSGDTPRPYWFFEVTTGGIEQRASIDGDVVWDYGTREWHSSYIHAFEMGDQPKWIVHNRSAVGFAVLELNTSTWAATRQLGLLSNANAQQTNVVRTKSGKIAIIVSPHITGLRRVYDYQPGQPLGNRYADMPAPFFGLGTKVFEPSPWNHTEHAVVVGPMGACFEFDYELAGDAPDLSALPMVPVADASMTSVRPGEGDYRRGLAVDGGYYIVTVEYASSQLILFEHAVQTAHDMMIVHPGPLLFRVAP